jgi:thiol-disulfide isomerase/thioredoxin
MKLTRQVQGQMDESRGFLIRSLLLFACIGAGQPALAFKPEIGERIGQLPVMLAGGAPVNWSGSGAPARIVVFGASWCQPCQELRAMMPIELKRLREDGVRVDAYFVEVDGFGSETQQAASRSSGVMASLGYLDLVPDPKLIDLKRENPRGIKNWGQFSIYGFPTTFLLDANNVVVARYRGGTNSRGAFSDARAVIAAAPMVTPVPANSAATVTMPTEPAVSRTKLPRPDPTMDVAADDLLGVWKLTITDATIQAPPYLRIVGLSTSGGGSQVLEASLSRRLSAWAPVTATCECATSERTLRLTSHRGVQMVATRQSDGSYLGSAAYPGKRHVERAIRFEKISSDDVEL